MRIAVRSAIGWLLVATACVAIASALLLWVAFPRIIGGESFRESVSASLGSELGYSGFELAYFPPTIVLFDPTLGGVDAFARADRATLAISLPALLAKVVLVDSATIEGAVLRLVRSDHGVWFTPAPGVAAAGVEQSDPAPDTGLRFAVRKLSAPNATVVLEDHAVSPPVRWELRNAKLQLELQLEMKALERSQRFDLAGEVASGGRVAAAGEVSSGGELNGSVRVEGLSIAPAAPYFLTGLPSGLRPDLRSGQRIRPGSSKTSGAGIDGALSGTLTAADRNVEFEFELHDGRLTLGEIAIGGRVSISGRIDRKKRPHGGDVELDVTAAELRYGDFFTKPPGTRGRVRGQVTSGADGALRIDRWKFEMDDFDGRANL